jgi:hypothetical protein
VVYRRGTFTGPTTTTLPPLCASNAGCADTDPCTDDTCDPPTGCHHDSRIDVGSPACVFDYGLETAACASDTGFAKLQPKLDRGHTLIDNAAAAPKVKRARKLLKQASAALRAADTKAAKLARKGKLSTDCQAAVDHLTGQVRDRIAGVLAGL